MLRAFLVVWTIVAGLAAGGLLYIVGWRPQTSVVAERLISQSSPSTAKVTARGPVGVPAEDTRAGNTAPPPVAHEPTSTASANASSPAASSTPWTDVVRRDLNSAANPASTGSIARAPEKTQRTAQSSENRPEAPAAGVPQKLGEADPPKHEPDAGMNAVAGVSAVEGDLAVAPPSARSGRLPSAVTQGSVPSDRDRDGREHPTHATSSAIAASSPSSDSDAKPARRKLQLAARPTPEVTSSADAVPEHSTHGLSNRTLKQRARATKAQILKTQTARAPERVTRSPRTQTPRVTALVEERAARSSVANEAPQRSRREARLARRMRVAGRESRDGSLEQLMDEFSRSGADFLHERTMRVGGRYLVERTTRLGTQYYYQESMR